MSNILIVDRIEGEFAVCQNSGQKARAIPLSLLPEGLREGDCLRQTPLGYILDPEEMERRRNINKALFDKLIKKRSGE